LWMFSFTADHDGGPNRRKNENAGVILGESPTAPLYSRKHSSGNSSKGKKLQQFGAPPQMMSHHSPIALVNNFPQWISLSIPETELVQNGRAPNPNGGGRGVDGKGEFFLLGGHPRPNKGEYCTIYLPLDFSVYSLHYNTNYSFPSGLRTYIKTAKCKYKENIYSGTILMK
jgi:hypothetical protein